MADCYDQLFQDDIWLAMLENIKEPRNRNLLHEYAALLVGVCEGPDGQSNIPDAFTAGLFKKVGAAYQRALRFAKMVLVLLDPLNFGWDVDPVKHFLQYAGKAVWENAVKQVLSSKAEGAKPGPDKDRKLHIQIMITDITRTQASMPVARAACQGIVAALQQEDAPPAVILAAAQTLKTVQSNVRVSLAHELKEKIGENLSRQALAIVQSLDPDADSETVSALLGELKQYPLQKACTEAAGKLSAWIAKHNQTLVKKDVLQVMQSYNTPAESNPNRLAEIPMDIKKLKFLLSKAKSYPSVKDDQEIARVCSYTIAYMLKDGFHQARWCASCLLAASSSATAM